MKAMDTDMKLDIAKPLDFSHVSQHLDRVFYEFLGLFDYNIQTILKKKAYFAGGCIYCLVNGKKVKDYDIFLTDDEDTKILRSIPEFWQLITDNALTYDKFQLILKHYGPPKDCVGQFDFKHNMYYYIPYSKSIQSACGEFNSLYSTQLLFNEERARDIERVYVRIKKFTDRGFTITAKERKKIMKKTDKDSIKAYRRSIRRYKVKRCGTY